MSYQPKSKGIFDSLLNAVTTRDEKAAVEAARQQVAEMEKQLDAAELRAAAAEKKAADLQAQLTKAQTESQAALAKVQAELQTARATIASVQQRAMAAEAKVKAFENEKALTAQQAAALEAAKAQVLATHTLTSEETLSHLSLKYYGHATEPYWRIIYEANKDVIGPNPNKVRGGLVLTIPVLPDEMKK
ncbi:MAG: hypothetical protein JXB15_09500 [Anaerolineales bacterium]|nr:hypothetical protein [Anaerolineales bacterium]